MQIQTVISFTAVIFLACFIIFIVWRLASRRHALPCPVWLNRMVEMDNPFTKTNRAATIISHLDLDRNMTVLDAGCGPGRLTLPIAQKIGPQGIVIALDVQNGMLARVKRKAETANLTNVILLQARLGQGILRNSSFERALLVTVLGEIPDREKALHEIFNCLKPGGILSITEVIFDPHFQRQRTVINLAATVGFQKKAIFGNGIAYTINFEKPFPDKE